MRWIAALCVIVVLNTDSARAFTGLQHSYYRSGKRFDFALTCEQVDAALAWRPEEPYPPLSPRQAVVIAEESLQKLFPPPEIWIMMGISLTPVCSKDHWYYAVEFSQGREGISSDTLTIPVLMDGTTAKPAISSWPK